jgi:1,4-alpha-glucan branching enzyme
MAIAAGLVCALLGAGTTAALLLSRQTVETGVTAESGVLPVRFRLVAPDAGQVSLVGDFNRWDPVALPLRRSADGRTWEVEVRLRPGRYSYSFVVDGRLARDPAAPQEGGDDYGSPNSVLLLRGS